MQELVPYLFVKKQFLAGKPVYVLNILINAPENKAVKRITEFPDLGLDFPIVDTSDNPFESNIFTFKYKVVDKEEGFISSIIPNIYTDIIELKDLDPEFRGGEKIYRTEGIEFEAIVEGEITALETHYPIHTMKDRVVVHIMDIDENTNQNFIRSVSIMTDIAETTASGPGEEDESDGSKRGHPFI